MNLSSLTSLTIPEGIVSQITGADGKVLWSSVSYDPVFANNTWEQIVNACHRNRVPDTWAVGDQKAMAIGGKDYLIDIIGKKHDDYSDGSGKAPLTFQMHDCHSTAASMNSSLTSDGGWGSCNMRNTTLPSILETMPEEVQNGIRKVNKLTSEGSASSNIVTTEDGLFLPSEVEIIGESSKSFAGEGSQYTYYADGNSAAKVGTSGSKINWWTRSPSTTSGYFVTINSSGVGSRTSSKSSFCIAVAFCF